MNGEAATPEETKAFNAHQELWFRQNGAMFVVALFVFLGATMFLASFKHSLPKPVLVSLILGLMAACGGAVALGIKGSRKHLDSRELELMMPALRLTPIQEAYSEALIALSALKLDAGAHEELIAQFNALLDEEARLLALRNPRRSSGDVRVERDELRARLASTTDSFSREALQRSLEICERRVDASRELGMVDERVDAQLQMIAQSMRNFRDTLQRLQAAPVQSGFNIDPIRDTIRQAQQHAQALEMAVREVESV